ncbi:hypothetical protein V7793_21095 [Streptomyces sp. KLMMK]|uniref:hypothetical protein n=1 Tax=Streptomyces sp. KLMMK TaxID=3109353 RepID=UPI00300A138F
MEYCTALLASIPVTDQFTADLAAGLDCLLAVLGTVEALIETDPARAEQLAGADRPTGTPGGAERRARPVAPAGDGG